MVSKKQKVFREEVEEAGRCSSWNRVDLGQFSANTTVIIVVVVAVLKRNQLIDKRPFDEVLQEGRAERGERSETS